MRFLFTRLELAASGYVCDECMLLLFHRHNINAYFFFFGWNACFYHERHCFFVPLLNVIFAERSVRLSVCSSVRPCVGGRLAGWARGSAAGWARARVGACVGVGVGVGVGPCLLPHTASEGQESTCHIDGELQAGGLSRGLDKILAGPVVI